MSTFETDEFSNVRTILTVREPYIAKSAGGLDKVVRSLIELAYRSKARAMRNRIVSLDTVGDSKEAPPKLGATKAFYGPDIAGNVTFAKSNVLRNG